jgi:hypothetical protein
MAPEQKSDLVCAFHHDLEGYLARIERKVDRIENKVGELGLWRARVVGYAAGVSAAVALLFHYVLK